MRIFGCAQVVLGTTSCCPLRSRAQEGIDPQWHIAINTLLLTTLLTP